MAEEFEQLDNQSGTPPVMLQLPSELSHDSSSTQLTTDNVLPGDTSTDWSVDQSPLMSPYGQSSTSLESSESPVPMTTQRLYKPHTLKKPTVGSHDSQRSHDPPRSLYYGSHAHDQPKSHDQPGSHDQSGSHDQPRSLSQSSQEKRSHNQNRGSHDHDKGSHELVPYDAYMQQDSFSCPDLSMLDGYGERRHAQHFSADGQSAIWDERFHDNCASMTNIHFQSGTARDHPSNHAARISVAPNNLPSVVEESSPSSAHPPSHVYKVMIDMASYY